MRQLLSCLASIAIIACGGGAKQVEQTARTGDVAIVDVTIVPMDREGTVAGQTVLVRGGEIVAVGPVGSIHTGSARVVDGRGKWLVPGLADMHVHVFTDKDLALLVWNGVTTVRNMFGSPLHVSWKQKIASGELLGPTLITAGPIVDGDPPFWPGSAVVTSAADAERVVAEQKAAGYDFIKIYEQLTPDSYRAVLAAAKRHGLPVDGHVPRAVKIDEAIRSGQRSIEHLTGYIGLTRGEPPAGIAEATARSGVWNCPTMIVVRNMSMLDDLPSLEKTPGLDHVDQTTRQMWDPKKDFRFKNNRPEFFAALKSRLEPRRKLVGELARAGARIVLGTDTGNPFVIAGFAVHEELGLMVEAGLTPWQALRSATAAPAEMLGTPGRFGVIAPGARADLILVDRDPLADLGALATPSTVILRGQVLAREKLAARVDELEKAQVAPTGKLARLPPIQDEGRKVAAGHYEYRFGDNAFGEERLVLSSLADGSAVVRGQSVSSFPSESSMTYRSRRTELDIDTDELEGAVKVVRAADKVIATVGGGKGDEIAAPADAVIAPQTAAEFIWYAEGLATLKVGDKKAFAAVEVTTTGKVDLGSATFTFTRRPDQEGARAYDFSGTAGRATFTGTMLVDPDRLPRHIEVKLMQGVLAIHRDRAEP